ncbi:hypothetical protein HA402_002529 [Bradysia odoriphaga]|nr:hypothetical protein HA402_002529 [Bradysia odoriphaga]
MAENLKVHLNSVRDHRLVVQMLRKKNSSPTKDAEIPEGDSSESFDESVLEDRDNSMRCQRKILNGVKRKMSETSSSAISNAKRSVCSPKTKSFNNFYSSFHQYMKMVSDLLETNLYTRRQRSY